MALKINIHAIKYNKANELNGTMTVTTQELDLDIEEVNWLEPVTIHFRVSNAGDVYLFEAQVTFSYHIPCSRCLALINVEEELAVKEQFGRRGHEQNADEELLPVQGDEIDVTESIRDHILLTLPVKPLCSRDCAGICPICGSDKNVKSCACRQDNIDPRLATLKKLLK